MKSILSVTLASLVALSATSPIQAQEMRNPHSYPCSAYLAGQDTDALPETRMILYWATGYLQGRLAAQPTVSFTTESYGNDMRDVHAALLQICPNVPDMPIATFMSNLAADFESSATQ